MRSSGILQVVVATLLFSFVGPVAKLVALDAGTISFWRALFGGVALLAFIAASRRAWRVRRFSHLLGLLALGLFTCGNWYWYVLAVQVSTVAVAVLCLFTYPLLTALLEPIVFHERVRPWDLVSGVLVVLGVLLIVERFSWNDASAQGAVYGLLSSISLTLRNLLSRKAVRSYPSSLVTLYQFAVAALVFLPFALGRGQAPGRVDWLLLVLLGALLTAASHALFIASLKQLRTSFASILVSMQPVYATLIAYGMLQEIPTPRTLVGGGLILAAVFLALAVRHRAAPLRAGSGSAEAPLVGAKSGD